MSTLRLPAWRFPEHLPPAPRPAPAPKHVTPGLVRPLQILVAHEQGILRHGIRALLRMRRGWEICGEVSTGWEAVVQAQRLSPDVAVVNLTLPRLSGLEVARRIRDVSPKTEILMLSVYFVDDLIPELFAAGVRGYVLNTDCDHDLLAAIESLGNRTPFLTAQATQMLMSSSRVRAGNSMLSARERDVLRLVSAGNSNDQAAAILGITRKTVESHRANVRRKLNLHSMPELVRYAIRNQIIQP